MKRPFFAAVALLSFLLIPAPAGGGALERTLEGRWAGSWVVTHVDVYSDCDGGAAKNAVRGGLVRGDGRQRFGPGELARVESVRADRSEVTLVLALDEPILVARTDGPYTLYREAACRVTLEMAIPKDLGRARDIEGIESILGTAVERHGSADGARAARAWNRRQRDPYPDGYERTLIEYAAWKADGLNAETLKRFDRVLEATARASQRIGQDPAYLAGFTAGARAARGAGVPGCPELLKIDFEETSRDAAEVQAKKGGARDGPSLDGYRDGHMMVHGLSLLRRLRSCIVTASEAAASPAGGGR